MVLEAWLLWLAGVFALALFVLLIAVFSAIVEHVVWGRKYVPEEENGE